MWQGHGASFRFAERGVRDGLAETGMVNRLLPPPPEQDEAQDDGNDEGCRQGEIEAEVFPLDGEITR